MAVVNDEKLECSDAMASCRVNMMKTREDEGSDLNSKAVKGVQVLKKTDGVTSMPPSTDVCTEGSAVSSTIKRRLGRPRKQNNLSVEKKAPVIECHTVSCSSNDSKHENTEKDSKDDHLTLRQKKIQPKRSTRKRKSLNSSENPISNAKIQKSGNVAVDRIYTESTDITKTSLNRLEIPSSHIAKTNFSPSEKQDTNILSEVEVTELVDNEGPTIEAIYRWSQKNQSNGPECNNSTLKVANTVDPKIFGKKTMGRRKKVTSDSAEMSRHKKSKLTREEYEGNRSAENTKITEKKRPGRPKKHVVDPDSSSVQCEKYSRYSRSFKPNAAGSKTSKDGPLSSALGVTRPSAKGKKRIGKPPVLGKFDCKHCDFVATEKNLLTKHMVVHRKPVLQCQFCDFSTTSLTVYLQHDTSHTKIKHFKCDTCGFASRVKVDLMRHMVRHSDEKNFKCPHCDFTTKWRTNIRHHVLRHTSDRPYKCTICPMAFKRIQDLQYHLYRHSDVKPLKCDKCDFRCKTNYELKFHQHKHSNVRSFKCTHPNCRFASKTRSDLTKHLKVHSNDRNFKCPLCSRAFKSASARNKHIKRHSDDRPFICEICKKQFKTKPCIYKHMHLHMDIKPFTCDICQKRFTNKSNMIKHKETHDRQNRPFPCPICPYWGITKHNLLAHIGTMHSNSFAYFCELCKKPFRRYASLKIHYNRMHTAEELEHIPSVFDLKPCKSENIRLEKGEETKKSISKNGLQVKGITSGVKMEPEELADDGQSEMGKSNLDLNAQIAIESPKMGLNKSTSLSGKNQYNTKLSTCVTRASQDSAGTTSSNNLPEKDDKQTADLEEENADSTPTELDILPESNDVSKSSEGLSSCSATLAMYDDFRLPLATKGFKFNLDKNGIKPKSWFMNPTNIQQPKEQLRQLEYMWKKHQYDKGLKKKPSTYKKFSRDRKIAYLKEQLKGVDDYCPDAKPFFHTSFHRRSYLKGQSDIPSYILNSIKNTNLCQKPKLLTVPAKVSEEASQNIKKIPLHDRLLSIGKTEPGVDVKMDQEAKTLDNMEVQRESAGPSAINSKGQCIKYYFKGKAVLSYEVKTENSKSAKDSDNAVLKASKGNDVHSLRNGSDPKSPAVLLDTMSSEEYPSDACQDLSRNLIKLEPEKFNELAKNSSILPEAVENNEADILKSTSADLDNVVNAHEKIIARTKVNSTMQSSAPLNSVDEGKQRSKPRGRPRKAITNEENRESLKVPRPRGRPRVDCVQSNSKENQTRKSKKQLSDSNLEVLKRLRGRPKAISCHKDIEETVKRPRGRPRAVKKSPKKPVRGRGRPPGSFKFAKMDIFTENLTSEKMTKDLSKKNTDSDSDHLSPALLKLRQKHARLANVTEDRIVMVQPKPESTSTRLNEEQLYHADEDGYEHLALKEPEDERSRILKILARTKDIVLENALTNYGSTRMKIDKSVTQKYAYVHSSGKVTKVTSKGKVMPMTKSCVHDQIDNVRKLDLNFKLVKQIKILKEKIKEAEDSTCHTDDQSRDIDLTEDPSSGSSILEFSTSNEDHDDESVDKQCVDVCAQSDNTDSIYQQSKVTEYLCQTTERNVTGYSIQQHETDSSNQQFAVPVVNTNTHYLVVSPPVNTTYDTNMMDTDTMETKPDVNVLNTSSPSSISVKESFLTCVPFTIKQEVDDTADYAFATNQQYSTADGHELDHSASDVQYISKYETDLLDQAPIPSDTDPGPSDVKYISNYETDQLDQAPIPSDTDPGPSDVKFYSDDVVSLRQKSDLDNDNQVTQDPLVNAVINDTEDENIVHVMRLQDIKVEQYLGYNVNFHSGSTVESNHDVCSTSNQCVSMDTESQAGDSNFENASEETTSPSEEFPRLNIASVFCLQNTNVNSEKDLKEEPFQSVAVNSCSSQQRNVECGNLEIQEKSENPHDIGIVKQEVEKVYK